jgi:hypothetical protein
MSTNFVVDPSGLKVTEYPGPWPGFSDLARPATADRRRYQITNDAGLLTTLSRAEWEALGEWFTRDCSPECEGPHLGFTWDTEPQ